MKWFESVGTWAKNNFGSISSAVVLFLTGAASVIQHAVPIVRKLDEIKKGWKNEDGTEHDFRLIRDVVDELKMGDDQTALQIANAVYVHKNVNLTLFNAAVLLLRQRSPMTPTPILNASVEIAYNIMLMLGK